MYPVSRDSQRSAERKADSMSPVSMSPVARKSADASRLLDVLYAPIQEELAGVEEILSRELRSKYPFVDELVRHGFRLGGKRLRPALVLLAGKAAGKITREHLVLAAVVEMIHTATLVHDDVLDQASIRRHLDTVNSRWGNEASVLLGDYLFTHSFYLASTLDSPFACQTIGRATNIVCEGELRQIASRGQFGLSEADYLGIIEAKTAELCACCCRLGSHYAGATAEVEESLARFGRSLGIAFQIVDDLLDLQGDEATTGKSLGTDLEQQKPTLPVIRLLDRVDGDQRSQLIAILSRSENHRRVELEPWLAKSDSLTYTRTQAEAFAARARDELACLDASPARDVLASMTEFVVQRRQ